MRFHIKCSPEC